MCSGLWPHISGLSREQLAPSTHNESAPEQCMRCLVQDCMAEMVSTPWCRPRYGPLTSVHGAELWCLNNTNTNILEKFQRDRLKQLQGLPPRTSNCVTLAMMGMFPITAEIDRKSLTFFRNIIKDKNSLEFDICEKQLTLKGSKSRS